MKRIFKINLILALLLLTVLFCSSLNAQTRSTKSYTDDENLYFKLTTEQIYVNGTTGEGDTVAVLAFQIKRTGRLMPSFTIDHIGFEVSFEGINFDTAYVDETNWGDGSCDATLSTGKVDIWLSGDTYTLPTSDYETFCYLIFTLDCAAELDSIALAFNEDQSESYIEDDDERRYPADSDQYIKGYVINNDDYTATFDIADITEYGGLGQSIYVPVLTSSSFRLFSLEHFILVASDTLDFDSFWVHDDSYWQSISTGSYENGDTIKITMINDDGEFTPEYLTQDTLYWLAFTEVATNAWDSNTTVIQYIDDSCIAKPYIDESPYYCDDLVDPYLLYDGSIEVSQYTGEFKLDFEANGCDDYLERDGDVTVMVQMENEFRAGHDNSPGEDKSISMVIYFDEMLSGFSNKSIQNDSVYFACALLDSADVTYGLHAISEYNASYPGTINMNNDIYEDMFSVKLAAEYDFVPDSYNDTTKTVNFRHTFDSESSYIEDVTDKQSVDSSKGTLDFESDNVKLMIGEFLSTEVTGDTCTTTQDIYIRCHADIDSFAVKITGETDLQVDDVTPHVTGVTFTTIASNSTTIYTDGDFSTQSATGQDSIRVATVTYKGGVRSPGEWVEFTPSISIDNSLIKSNGDEAFVVKREGDVDIYLQACSSGGSSKTSSSTEIGSLLPTEFALHHNYPNPFNPDTRIAFDLPVASQVRIDIINILGQRVKTLVDEYKSPGYHEVLWNSTSDNGTRVASGIYFYRMEAGEFVQSRKMILLK